MEDMIQITKLVAIICVTLFGIYALYRVSE
jgi:hypothetical protein